MSTTSTLRALAARGDTARIEPEVTHRRARPARANFRTIAGHGGYREDRGCDWYAGI